MLMGNVAHTGIMRPMDENTLCRLESFAALLDLARRTSAETALNVPHHFRVAIEGAKSLFVVRQVRMVCVFLSRVHGRLSQKFACLN